MPVPRSAHSARQRRVTRGAIPITTPRPGRSCSAVVLVVQQHQGGGASGGPVRGSGPAAPHPARATSHSATAACRCASFALPRQRQLRLTRPLLPRRGSRCVRSRPRVDSKGGAPAPDGAAIGFVSILSTAAQRGFRGPSGGCVAVRRWVPAPGRPSVQPRLPLGALAPGLRGHQDHDRSDGHDDQEHQCGQDLLPAEPRWDGHAAWRWRGRDGRHGTRVRRVAACSTPSASLVTLWSNVAQGERGWTAAPRGGVPTSPARVTCVPQPAAHVIGAP
jgi:hypothetical protein